MIGIRDSSIVIIIVPVRQYPTPAIHAAQIIVVPLRDVLPLVNVRTIRKNNRSIIIKATKDKYIRLCGD